MRYAVIHLVQVSGLQAKRALGCHTDLAFWMNTSSFSFSKQAVQVLPPDLLLASQLLQCSWFSTANRKTSKPLCWWCQGDNRTYPAQRLAAPTT